MFLLAIGGCISENEFGECEQQESEAREIDVLLNIAFHLNDPATGASTRGTGATRADETTPGVPVPESELKSLSVFVLDLDDSGNPLPATVKAFRFTDNLPVYTIDGTSRGVHKVLMKTKPGRKHIYMAANLSSQQDKAFIEQYKVAGEQAVLTSNGVSDFISSENGFAMFCMDKQAIEITQDQLNYPDENDASYYGFTLERLAAKVLLTADTYDGGSYVKISKEAIGENGWVKLTDVTYNLNTTNTKIYPFPVTNGTGNRIDPNPEIGGSTDDFIPVDLSMSKSAVRYDANKMPKVDSDPVTDNVYTDGIYCLENIARDAGGHSDEERMNYTTHMRVTARYIPRHLYIVENGKVVRQTYATVDAAEQVIADQSASGSTYTTTQNSSKYYYTGEAKELAVSNGSIAEDTFTEYPGCRHYYTTYLDGVYNAATGKIDFSNEYSSIFRNRYYILRVTEFDIVNGPLLQITSTVLPWNKEDGGIWYSEISASLKSAFEQNNYTETENPDGIPISFNMMNTTGGGTDTYNATFILSLTGSPGVSWTASLSNPANFGIYVNTEKNLAANGTLPVAGTPGVTDNGNGTVTKDYKIAVYAKQAYDGVTKKTYLSITADGMRQLINSDSPSMPGDQENILIIQH
jgi:hypothetical protein